MLKIIIDENIAFAKEAFNQFGEIDLLPGNKITNNRLKDADILIVRSVTKVDEALLKGTTVKFVGTATIGTDHIELDYLKKNNITFADAKGCNAYSVAEYVTVSLLHLAVKLNLQLKGKTVGIVGVGNIGSKVAAFADALGMEVLLNDPPLQRQGVKRSFVSLNEILEADIITFHVPLNKEGIDKTFHILDENKFSTIKKNTIIINSSRGAVIDNKALLKAIGEKNLKVVLDVWENEPNISIDLLKEVVIGTPHIAGYSLEGKVNGTIMIYNALCDYLKTQKTFKVESNSVKNPEVKLSENKSTEKKLNDLISKIYDVKSDDELMRKTIFKNEMERILYFNDLRKNYPLRREFPNYKITIESEKIRLKYILEQLRFKVTI